MYSDWLVNGFVLLTWSASFTYLEMERFWRPRQVSSAQDYLSRR